MTKHKKPAREKLLDYGFSPEGDLLCLRTRVCGDEFELKISVYEDGSIDTDLHDLVNDGEYILYKTSASGEYVGMIRDAVKEEVKKVVASCYDDASFCFPQTLRLLRYVKESFGDELSFLGEDRIHAILRNKSSDKWYALFSAIPLSKMGYETTEKGEVVGFRCKLAELPEKYAHLPLYPGYHMNKTSWATIVLDESVSDKELFELIDASYMASQK